MPLKHKPTRATNANSVSGSSPLAVLTVDEVAARLQISKASVYELTRFREVADTPRLPARKIGRSLRFVAADIDAWILALPKHSNLQKRRYLKKDAERTRIGFDRVLLPLRLVAHGSSFDA